MNATVSAFDAGFILAVTGAASVWWPLGLLMGAIWLAVTVVVTDRRTAAAVEAAE